jgi:hypothetical protein
VEAGEAGEAEKWRRRQQRYQKKSTIKYVTSDFQ